MTGSSNFEIEMTDSEEVDYSPYVPSSEIKAKFTNGFAIAGFILALFYLLLGLIFSIIGLVKSKKYGSGKGLAIAGIVIPIIYIVIYITAFGFLLFLNV